jgi:hypothetical protein
MTECIRPGLHFTPAHHRQLVADFSGGHITSDAGALLLREADRQLGLTAALDAAIPDPRNPAFLTHPQQTLLTQRLFALACGYEDLNDHQHLRDDPLWATLADHPAADGDKPVSLASPPTLCRLENRITRPTLVRLAQVLVDQFLASYDTPPEHLTLDFDATDDPVHGHQENRFFHGYYDGHCFLPLYVFCGTRLLVAYLRPADRDASHHTAAILKLVVTRLRQVWPNVRITIRADGGFCRWRLMRWCDHNDIRYILGLARNPVLEREVAPLLDRVKREHQADGPSHRRFQTFAYAAQTWDRPRRVIAKAEHLASDKANPRFVVTNLPGDPQELYEDVYCERGEMENRIKEQQLGLFAGRTSCHRFPANPFRVLLAAFAYVLVEHIRRTALVGTDLAHAQVGTIRLRLFKIGALVTRSVRRIVVRMASGYPWADVFARAARCLTQPRIAAAPA